MIMKHCAPKISKHFTKLTAVIVENTQYEFPSSEIHKAVISKLILNDQKYFKTLVTHLQAEFKLHEPLIRENYPVLVTALECFLEEVSEDMRENHTKIDVYMRDLRKHALSEYEELYRKEQENINMGKNADGKKKHKKKNRKRKKNAAVPTVAADGVDDAGEGSVEANGGTDTMDGAEESKCGGADPFK